MPDEDNPVDSVGSITQNYRALLGYRISEWSDGEAVMDLDMRSALHNTAGVMHGGAIASLIDAACGHAATWSDDPDVRDLPLRLISTSLLPDRSLAAGFGLMQK
nr:PaaI family thioesterase [Brucella anthropi]